MVKKRFYADYSGACVKFMNTRDEETSLLYWILQETQSIL